MYRVVVACTGISGPTASAAVADIVEEFAQRPWHNGVSCTVETDALILEATNDYDRDGLALLDEFSDVVCACVPIESGTIGFHVRTVSQLDSGEDV